MKSTPLLLNLHVKKCIVVLYNRTAVNIDAVSKVIGIDADENTDAIRRSVEHNPHPHVGLNEVISV